MNTPRHLASARVMNFFRSPISIIFTRPWLDALIIGVLRRYFFPLSRLWAIAREAEGDVDKFTRIAGARVLGAKQQKRLMMAISKFEHRRLNAFMTEQLWHDYLFGSQDVALDRVLIAEEMRIDSRNRYNLTRSAFMPFRRLLSSSVKMRPPNPQQVIDRLGANAERVEELFALPAAMPTVESSRRIPVPHGHDYWLRFASPSAVMADTVYARVHEPLGVSNPPSLIFGHGVCVEFDHYHNLIDEVAGLLALGIRVIRPEAPWHGRRVLPGHFGGEQLLATTPTGMFDFLAAQHQEWAVLIDWCRGTSGGAIAIGGSSLGAQTAKAIAVRARKWPERLRPDALLAIVHCEHIAEAALDGDLSDIWNLAAALKQAGWNRDLAEHWLLRLDPPGIPCMAPQRIVSVTGSRDRVTPESSAIRQLDAWAVPAANRFSQVRGHFSVPLGMLRDRRPLLRLREVLRECNQSATT